MKLKLTESQYLSLLNYINEARQAPVPTNLSSFFNKNNDVAYFTIVKLIQKTKDESEYLFAYDKINGFDTVKDVNQGTVTRGCVTDANLDTMIYDDEFTLTFASCQKTLKINNVVGIRLFDKKHNKLDEMKFNNTSTQNKESLVDRYNDELKSSNNGDEVFFDTFKKQYDGTVLNKSSDRIEIELHESGKNTTILLYVNLDNDGFYEENGDMFFQATKKDVKKDTETEFHTPIKSFSSTNTGNPQEPEINEPDNQETEPEEPEDEPIDDKINPSEVDWTDEEELMAQAKLAYDEILNDKRMQTAFYRKPNFWELFKAELEGKKAKGKGIISTVKIVKGAKSNMIDGKLKGDFNEGEQVIFKPYHNEDIIVYAENDDKPIGVFRAGAESQAKVKNFKLGEKTKYLEHRGNNNSFTITIKKPTDVPNVYLCDIKQNRLRRGEYLYGTKDNVYLEFDPTSKGYRPLPKQTNP